MSDILSFANIQNDITLKMKNYDFDWGSVDDVKHLEKYDYD